MKKIISFVVGALMLSTAAWADSYVVVTKADFGIAWNAIGKTVGQKDTIIVTASMGGINVNTKDTGPQKVLYILLVKTMRTERYLVSICKSVSILVPKMLLV